MPSLDSFKSKRTLTAAGKTYTYYSIEAASQNGLGDVSHLPASLKVLLEIGRASCRERVCSVV